VEISFIQPSRDNLKYLKWSYDSIRKNQGNHDVEICVADDNSNDGTWEWCLDKMKTDSNFKAIRNDSGERKGHTLLYDELLNDVSTKENAIIFHSDMYLAPGALDAIEKHLKKGVIVSLTRVEPPLHPPGPEKVLQGFGIETEEFDEKSFLKFHSDLVKNNKDKVTEGIFAPWAFVKSDFQEIKGHDPLYRPQSKEDSIGEDTLLYVCEEGYRIQYKVKDLWDKYSSHSYMRDDGVEVINFKDTNTDIKTMSAHKGGGIGMDDINYILRKKTNRNRLVKLKTNHGEVVVTEDHSLIDVNCDAIKVNDLTTYNIWQPNYVFGELKNSLLFFEIFQDDLIIETDHYYSIQKIMIDYICKFDNLFYDVSYDNITKKYKLIISKDKIRDDFIEIERFEGDDEVYVYDLEVNKSHTFIGGTGLIGLHNSDIFDRFHINGIKFIQTWEGYVYHMTCRGSRYNPNLTTVGKESDEWLKQNVKSTRNFIRKWGRFVSHDKYMKPIVYPRYKKLLNINNISLIDKNKQKELINLLEPWFDNINVNSDIVDDYIKEENKNTDFDLSIKFNTINSSDINVTIDVTTFGQQEFDYITMLPRIIQDSGEIGSFQLNNMKIDIKSMTDYNKDLIIVKK